MSGTTDSAEEALDALLATPQRGALSPLELRILLWLAERVGTQPEVANALDVSVRRVGRAATPSPRERSLDAASSGRRSQFVLSITSTGLLAAAPLVDWITAARRARKSDVWQRAGQATAARPAGEPDD
jgi:hypothetical protein